MRVATWNVNGMRARLDFVLGWLRARQPDVVGLQELKTTEEQFPRAEIEAEGYHALVHCQKSWNGVAVLTREPAEAVQVGLPGQEDFGARLLTARAGAIEGGGELSFTSVYVPNGKSVDHEDYPKKLAWLDALAEHFASKHEAGEPTLLCGDFNVTPAPLDSWNEAQLHGRVHHTDAERDRIRRLHDWGFRDVFRDKHPDLQAFSWWDYRGGAFHRKQGLRIDLLLATAPVLARARSVEIDREWRKKQDGLTPSDHAPVFADLA
jgi:exodeoxyribonuclease-3